MASSSEVPFPIYVFHLERPPLMLPCNASPFFIVSLSLPCTFTLCGNIHTSHIANVRMLSISLSVLLSVFHDLFTHFSPLRTSIFNRDGSMFSHSLIKDMVCMHNTHTHSMWMHYVSVCVGSGITACVLCLLFLWWRRNSVSGVFRVEPVVSRQGDTGDVHSN